MLNLHHIFVGIALICFLLAALSQANQTPNRGNLIAAGLFFWLASALL